MKKWYFRSHSLHLQTERVSSGDDDEMQWIKATTQQQRTETSAGMQKKQEETPPWVMAAQRHPPSPSPRTNPCLGRQSANSRRSLPTRPHRVPRKGQGTSMTFSSEDAVLSNLRSVLGLSVGKIRLGDDLAESKQVRHNKSSARFRHIKELANP